MPTLTRWQIKTSLVYLILALSTGIVLAAEPLFGWSIPGLFPGYLHLFVVGWLTMLIMGVVYWMFPKYSLEKPRRSERVSWAVYILLNTGLVMRIVTEPLNARFPYQTWGWGLALAALLQWLGGALFVLNTWGRVKER